MPAKINFRIWTIFVLLCLLLPLGIQAQIVQRFPFSLSVNAKIDLQNETVEMISSPPVERENRIKDLTLDLRHGELIISYSLDKSEKGNYYDIELYAELGGTPILLKPGKLIGDIGTGIETSAVSNFEIVWPGFYEQFLQIEDDFSLSLKATYVDQLKVAGLDCDNPPVFGFKQQWPFLATLAVAGGSIGAGQYYKGRSEDTYNTQYLPAGSLAEANPIYDKANQEHQQYLILTYAGAALIAGDLIWYVVRSARHQKRLKLFDEYCKEGQALNIDPVFSPGIGEVSTSTQLRLTFSF